jgi:hypothetical protein
MGRCRRGWSQSLWLGVGAATVRRDAMRGSRAGWHRVNLRVSAVLGLAGRVAGTGPVQGEVACSARPTQERGAG